MPPILAKPDPKLPEKSLWPQIITFLQTNRRECNTEGKRDAQIRSQFTLSKPDVKLLFKNKGFLSQWRAEEEAWDALSHLIPMSKRRERMENLWAIFEKVPEERISYKLKIIEMCRIEMDDQVPDTHLHLHGNIDTPPQAKDYDEWMAQNQKMKAVQDLDR